MASSSNALDVSAPTQDSKLMMLSHVNVSNFVNVKLYSIRNYRVWKAQMTCLLESQQLLHIVGDECAFPSEQEIPYDRLVKGWILGSMNRELLEDMVNLITAGDIWRKLEFQFNAVVIYPGITEYNYGLRAPKFNDRTKYRLWKDEMLGFIESHGLLYIIDAELPVPLEKDLDEVISQYDKLVKTWFSYAVNSYDLNRIFLEKDSAQYVWLKLESLFDQTIRYTKCTEDWKYMQASNVNVSSFVTTKLFGPENYKSWKAQILGLIKSQGLFHIIAREYPIMRNKDVHIIVQSDELVKGWIFGSVTENVLKKLLDLNLLTSHNVWRELDSLFAPKIRDDDTEDSDSGRLLLRTSTAGEMEHTDSIRRETLYKAAVEGCWWKTKSILKIPQNKAMEPVTTNGNTILHVAVELGHKHFVEELLEFLKDGNEIETRNVKGQTALHIAVMAGNEYAAQLLVQKSKQLLSIPDGNGKFPVEISFTNMKLNMCAYFNSSLPIYVNSETRHAPILSAIYTKQYDLAFSFIEKGMHLEDCKHILMAITINFPKDLSFTESFIYPSFHIVLQRIVVRCLFHSNIFDKCVDDMLRIGKIYNTRCCSSLGKNSMILLVPIATLYPIYQLTCLLILVLRLTLSFLYFLLWKILAVIVRPIKNIEEKRKKHKVAKKILSSMCNKIGELNFYLVEPLFQAIRQGTYEVVDEILFKSPGAISCQNEEDLSVIQLAIIYRSEKVYNLIHHIIDRTESFRSMKDSSNNNLVHIAGRLAPSFVLDRTTGAALQLQRELIWFKEVEKLMLPIELIRDKNIYNETPAMVFTREHQDLMKEGETWMKTTAESCSITAALIVTVVFAAAITVPGGSNQESGIPVLKKETAFTVFAVSNAFSLFTAATSLLLFLSILTARFAESDFLLSLPRRLIFGLLTLFLSTTAMIVAFGAILFLVFCDQRPWMLAPICGFACLPILVIVTIKVPLLIDLIQSTYFPIFGHQSYLDSCKINRKTPILTK